MQLIEVEAAILISEEIQQNKDIPKNYGTLLDIKRRIRRLPTIDAEPVVHAHWKNRKYRGIASSEWFNEWNCSKCGGSGCIRDKYCKHCGAEMNKEQE